MPTRQDLEYFNGNSILLSLTFASSGVAVDVSGWDIELTVKESSCDDDSDAVIQVAANLTDGAEGIAVFTVSHETTKTLLGHYWYDIKFIDDSSRVGTVLYGKMAIRQSINITMGDAPSSSPSSSPS